MNRNACLIVETHKLLLSIKTFNRLNHLIYLRIGIPVVVTISDVDNTLWEICLLVTLKGEGIGNNDGTVVPAFRCGLNGETRGLNGGTDLPVGNVSYND